MISWCCRRLHFSLSFHGMKKITYSLRRVVLLAAVSLFLGILLSKRQFSEDSNDTLTYQELSRVKENKRIDQIYDKIFILNLPRSNKRRERMEKMMKELDIVNYEFLNGVDGLNLDIPQMKKDGLFSPDNSLEKYEKMTAGEVGCSMSHINAWNTSLVRGYKSVMICEDDSRIDNIYIHKLASLVEMDTPQDWEILHWSTNKLEDSRRRHIAGRIYLSYDEWSGAVCYALSRKGAEKLVATAYPIKTPVDVYIGAFTKLDDRKSYIVLPPPISYQKKKHSVIDEVDYQKGTIRGFKDWWSVFWEKLSFSD